jgi:plasmid stabilization system protein ParE
MKNYRLSRAAQEDLREIKSYSLTTWGKNKIWLFRTSRETQ